MAVPLDNGLFNVFMSYCVAGGFGQPEYDSPDGIDPTPFQTVSPIFVFISWINVKMVGILMKSVKFNAI